MPFFIFWKLYKPGHRALRDLKNSFRKPSPPFLRLLGALEHFPPQSRSGEEPADKRKGGAETASAGHCSPFKVGWRERQFWGWLVGRAAPSSCQSAHLSHMLLLTSRFAVCTVPVTCPMLCILTQSVLFPLWTLSPPDTESGSTQLLECAQVCLFLLKEISVLPYVADDQGSSITLQTTLQSSISALPRQEEPLECAVATNWNRIWVKLPAASIRLINQLCFLGFGTLGCRKLEQ